MAPTAHIQKGLDQTDVFEVNKHGQLTVRWVTGGGQWDGPTPIGQGSLFPASAPLAASAQFGVNNQTNVYGVTNNGRLGVAWVTAKSSWSGPAEILDANYEPGAPVAASRQFGVESQTDLFAVNKRGDLTVAWVTGTGSWQGPHSLSHGNFPVKANVAVSQRFGRDITDVFAVNNKGELTVTSVEAKGQWSGQTALSPSDYFVPGSSIAAGQQFGLTQTDVFVVDKHGALTVSWFDGTQWNGPEPISSRGVFNPGAHVATSRQFNLDQTDVFAVNKDGAVTVSWVTNGGEWDGPQPISEADFAEPGATLCAHQQVGLEQTDVFVSDKGGRLNVLWVTNKGSWSGPEPI